MKKRFLSMVLAVLMVLTLLPIAAFAEYGGSASDPRIYDEERGYSVLILGRNDTKQYIQYTAKDRGIMHISVEKPKDDNGVLGSFTIRVMNEDLDTIWDGNNRIPSKESKNSKTNDVYVGVNPGIYVIEFKMDFRITSMSVITPKVVITQEVTDNCEIAPNETRDTATELALCKDTVFYLGRDEEHWFRFHITPELAEEMDGAVILSMQHFNEFTSSTLIGTLYGVYDNVSFTHMGDGGTSNFNYSICTSAITPEGELQIRFKCKTPGDYYIQFYNYDGATKQVVINAYKVHSHFESNSFFHKDVIKAPSENSEGTALFYCDLCGMTWEESIPKLKPTSTPTPAPTAEPTAKPTDKPDTKNPFKDVKKDAYYYDPVLWALNHDPQITKGTSDTTFSPEDTCTRGQVVTFLWRAAGCPEPSSTKNPFKDVSKSDYFYKAVLWAVENGITKGTSATTFSPKDPCTRAHVVTFLYRSEGTPKVDAKNPFKDVKSSEYFYDAVLWAVKNEITKGTDVTHFSPANPCTRGQIVTFLYRDKT